MHTPHVPHISADHQPIQVRFFREPDIADLETAINKWLALAPRREIVEIRQSVMSPSPGVRDLIVSVWYLDV